MNSMKTMRPGAGRRSDRAVRLAAAATACALCAGSVFAPPAQAAVITLTQPGAGPDDYTLNGNLDARNAGVPSLSGGTLRLTSPVNNQATSVFYNTPTDITNFTATWLYDMGTSSANPADGFAFVLQNDPRGPAALGATGGALGYGGTGAITPSVAIGYDIYNQNTGRPTRTGSAQNGGGFSYVDTGTIATATVPATGVNLRENPVRVDLSYRDGVFIQTLTDTVNGRTSTQRFNRNVGLLVGNTGLIGFTGGTGGLNAEQLISNFTLTTGNAAPVTPAAQILTNVPRGGAGFFGVREVIGAGNQTDLTTAQAAVTGTSGTITDYTASRINILDTGNPGRFAAPIDPDAPYRSNGADVGGADQINNIAVVATGRVRIPTTGTYTFAVPSDDGFRLTIGGQRFETVAGQGGTLIGDNGALEFRAGRGSGATSFGTITLAAGDYDIQLLNWEGTGGASLELAAAQGAHGSMNRNFQLVGAPAQTLPRRAGNLSPNGFEVVSFNNITDPDGAGTQTALDAAIGAYNAFRAGTRTADATVTGAPNVFFSDPNNRGANRNNQGDFGADRAFPNNTAADDNNFATAARGVLSITTPGVYTFDVLADDAIRFQIIDAAGNAVDLVDFAGGGSVAGVNTDADAANDAFRTLANTESFGFYNLANGDYTVELIGQEGGGGSSLALFGAYGRYDYFDPAIFQLIGQNLDTTFTRPAGLELVPEPSALSLLAFAGAGLLARKRRR